MTQLDLFDFDYHANFVRRRVHIGENWTTLQRYRSLDDMRYGVAEIIRMSRGKLAYVQLCERQADGRVVLIETKQLEGLDD